jgi:hypothetical protein
MVDQFISEINRIYGEKFVLVKDHDGRCRVALIGERGVPEEAISKPMTYKEAIALRQLSKGNTYG